MDLAKDAKEDFVTVVSVGNQATSESFVTVLSIGAGKKEDGTSLTNYSKSHANGVDGHLEEEVEVFRLPGERLGFGLKFEGGNKTSERVRRLFVQSCAEQSPASRAKCSWGTLGESDEVLSIDGVPVTHMTRLDCVRRLKESQLVIKLMVRCRGALRPEVVSAERKPSTERSKIPPELPSAPPPVPPRKLRQPRGSADGEANPVPVKKFWEGGKSQNGSPSSQRSSQPGVNAVSPYEVGGAIESSKSSVREKGSSPNGRSSELPRSKQEPPEAMVYMDARSQSGSTHGSTSDDTGSSMSTVVDRLSSSDRVSTISTTSTASTASEQQQHQQQQQQHHHQQQQAQQQQTDAWRAEREPRSRAICSFEHLENDFPTSPPDYLLRRLASSEAVTHVESRGEVERITAVVAPNTILIEETITLQPPLSFQDAPLSYGHEPRPDLFYAADLAADSTTHFRPIKDDAEVVERVNTEDDDLPAIEQRDRDKIPPPLPTRNHLVDAKAERFNGVTSASPKANDERSAVPTLPPKPLPRKDVKARRKRPPPPPPPPPSTAMAAKKMAALPRESPCSVVTNSPGRVESQDREADANSSSSSSSSSSTSCCRETPGVLRENGGFACEHHAIEEDELDDGASRTNKVLEIIEIRMARALSPPVEVRKVEEASAKLDGSVAEAAAILGKGDDKMAKNGASKASSTHERDSKSLDSSERSPGKECNADTVNGKRQVVEEDEDSDSYKDAVWSRRDNTATYDGSVHRESEDDETYRSLDEINDYLIASDAKNADGVVEMEEISRDNCETANDDTTDESDDDDEDEDDDDDYYWQSNLATIGEEEETNSLEYTNANKHTEDRDVKETNESTSPSIAYKSHNYEEKERDDADRLNGFEGTPDSEDKTTGKDFVNGRMENCGGGPRLPPDGDEFPAAYQEFGGSGTLVNEQQQYRTSIYESTTDEKEAAFVGNDGFKTRETARTLLLTDNRGYLTTTTDIEGAHRDTIRSIADPRLDDVDKPSTPIDTAKRATTVVVAYSAYAGPTSNTNNVLSSEKKLELADYYRSNEPTTIEKDAQSYPEQTVAAEVPPPLPLTGPPKLEEISPYERGGRTLTDQPQRKFSLNGESWRQDDKSERSVRDKIAMFSSQSSLDSPLFPVTVGNVASNARRLSKYKSSEDVCVEEKTLEQKDTSSLSNRTRSSIDLTDSIKPFGQVLDTGRKYDERSSCSSQNSSFNVLPATTSCSKPIGATPPPIPSKPMVSSGSATPLSFDSKYLLNVGTTTTPVSSTITNAKPHYATGAVVHSSNESKTYGSSKATPGLATLTRATSFSGSTPFAHERTSLITSEAPSNVQISRTNSLASTFRRHSEDVRRTSLNQLIEQRKRSISKLRGLVIPEREAVPINQPIVDLPEIKSRNSISLQQVPKLNIQDKWGSQSSISSGNSVTSAPLKATISFKMPAPQIHSKYSPAFKRKSLTVYGSSISSSLQNENKTKMNPLSSSSSATTISTAAIALSEPPKSLESICSPTRSDCSFDFVSTANSPDVLSSRQKSNQRRARMDYDDSDNDSAVSSSQSSISRGFSPPMSPVPSDRSTISSERSYISTEKNYQRRSLTSSPIRNFAKDACLNNERDHRSNILNDRSYVCSSSSGNASLQQFEANSRNSLIPQRQTLKRSNSTETNCSTSSTLTSGSQASTESLSRRILKPQSVEAINRKNILASARCRSGRDLNGSPLIQRKFTDDKETPTSTGKSDEGTEKTRNGKNGVAKQDVKIAYIEVADTLLDNDNSSEKKSEEPKLPPKKFVLPPAVRPPKSKMLEPSNDLKMWVRAEAKTLVRSMEEKSAIEFDKLAASQDNKMVSTSRNLPSMRYVERRGSNDAIAKNSSTENGDTSKSANEGTRQRTKSGSPTKRNADEQNDLLTILTTRSRSRSAIHVDDGTFGSKSKSQMSLEDILGGKVDSRLLRTQSVEIKTDRNDSLATRNNNEIVGKNADGEKAVNDSWNEDGGYSVSKIPMLSRSKILDSEDEVSDASDKSKIPSKIPMAKSLCRRSVSVTDMKKALEKMDVNSSLTANQQQTSRNAHNRFPSLDSSVDENISSIGNETDGERYYGEQFGSISSLASSTSLISQQELAQLVEEASLEETRGVHDVVVVLLHKENPTGSVGITLAGGADCEIKEITVHRVLSHSIADKDGRVQRGDRILSINGKSTRGLTHRESLTVLKQPRSEVVLVVSRARYEEGCKLRSRTASVETIVEGFETSSCVEDIAWGPPSTVAVYKDGAGLGFSLEGGRDSPLGDRPLIIKKIFTGGAAEKTGALKAGDQLLEVNGNDVTRMSRIEAWSLMKKLHDGEVNLLVRHPAIKSS